MNRPLHMFIIVCLLFPKDSKNEIVTLAHKNQKINSTKHLLKQTNEDYVLDK